ncbi:MAG: MBL fold metallo-hydrolase [Myxococcota bacterium]
MCAALVAGCDSDDTSDTPSSEACPEQTSGADTDVATDSGMGSATDVMADTVSSEEMCMWEEVAVNPTPPLPGDPCAEPQSMVSRVVEAGVRANQQQADATEARLFDPDRITIVMCGTGAPIPSDRVQSCTAVFVGGKFFVFDAGDGAERSMEDLGLPVTDITAVFVTHFHSDHIADLGEVISRSWILGRTGVLPVYGGPAIERVVDGFNLIYTADELYRRAHHGETVFAPEPETQLPAEARRIDDVKVEGTVVYDEDGVVVRAYGVDHSPVAPTLGFRVEYGGRSVGISGDTIDAPGLRALADGVDVLVSEVIDREWSLEASCGLERAGDMRNATIFRDIRTYHVDVDELAQLSADANVGTLVLTHAVPAVSADQAQTQFVAPMARLFDGEIIAAEDGDEIVVDVE